MTTRSKNSPARSQSGATISRSRWWFRPAAVLLGLSVFLVAELLFAIFGLGQPDEYEDPFVGFSETRPLFVLDDERREYRIPEPRQLHFAPDSFAAEKGVNEFRIFCLGGSTVQGRPYSKQTSFTTWLKLSLDAADATRDWEVVNCGGVSYASYRLVPILKECLAYEPDLLVICTGHNEFLEDRTYPRFKRTARWSAETHELASHSRTYNLLRSAAKKAGGFADETDPEQRPVLAAEVDAFLDYKEGLEAYERDNEWKAGVIAHFEQNLRGMVAVARAADVPVILVLPPSNLSDSPPFKSQHRDGLSAAELERWQGLVAESAEYVPDDLDSAIGLLLSAMEIDDQYALLHFQLANCYEAEGKLGSAYRHYELARELDICPLRTVGPIEAAIRKTAARTGVPLVDAHELLQSKCPSGILGERFLVDHVHPSIEGHQLIAEALFGQIARLGWVRQSEGWRQRRDALYAEQLESLDDIYYARGRQRLDNLRAWSKGRADGPPLSEHPRMRVKDQN